ncbi:7-carboxy-7-deazaguanine synthase QueE [Rubripirellula amarantea]|nr:7-carboxy-7-deazaguanine synthase QueE [Rubripirellula amarantea]
MDNSQESQFSQASAGPTRGTDLEDRESPSGIAQLKVSERFVSRQGEGRLTGVESFFIRTSGCNLRCHFCDTPYASWNPQGDLTKVDDLVLAALKTGLTHVVLTGGEPMLPKEIVGLTQKLREVGLHITIETAGTIDRDVECDLMSISPKLASSTPSADKHPRWNALHSQRRMPIDAMRRLIDRSDEFQLKFVVTSADDFNEIEEVVSALQTQPNDVWIMPEGVTNEAMDKATAWLNPLCEARGYQYCDRMQIRWYGNRRGT